MGVELDNNVNFDPEILDLQGIGRTFVYVFYPFKL
jgi:hypothetical protein